ncbi:hypothetical protein DSECCO2_492520 [anaerobic digester metagenome]
MVPSSNWKQSKYTVPGLLNIPADTHKDPLTASFGSANVTSYLSQSLVPFIKTL